MSEIEAFFFVNLDFVLEFRTSRVSMYICVLFILYIRDFLGELIGCGLTSLNNGYGYLLTRGPRIQ